jgi:hypothetical protein
MNQVLGVFSDITNVISRMYYPTSNLFLLKVWRIKEILDSKATDRNEYIRLMAAKMSDKFDKYWGESNLLIALAAALDPRYKMKLIHFYFSIIYPFNTTGERIKGVENVLKELYEVYVAAYNSSIIQQQAAAEVNASTSMAFVTEVVLGVGLGLGNIV